MTRREFTKSSGILLSMSMVPMSCKAATVSGELRTDFGLQLYSVREAMTADPIACLQQLAKIGYKHVESAGYEGRKFYGYTPLEYKKILTDLGLDQISGHTRTGYPYDGTITHSMESNWEQVCEDAAEINQKYLVLGWIGEDERKSIDDYKKLAEKLNICGKTAASFGIKMLYHNHDFEFHKLEDQVPYDVLLAETDADNLNFELDFYWYRKGGVKYQDYINKHPGRFPLWHIKDMDDTEEQFFTEVGTGVIDWKDVFTFAEKAGMEQYYVEQDQFKAIEPLESVEQSHDNLIKIVS